MRNSTTRLFFFAALLTFFATANSVAQVGQEFWFVAPEVTSNHGDDPVVFRITAFDQPAYVEIFLGTDQTNPIAQFTVPANSQYTYEGPNNQTFKDLIENKPYNQINDMGIHIVSDQDISVYYEVTDTNNPDKFTLKGENALGTEFFVPSQDEFYNHHFDTPARERIDIVATEDDTEVTIDLTGDVNGHSAGETITVTLDRGQTYSIWALGEDEADQLGGTYIASNHPVAVTISDDSIQRDGTGPHDLIGDQLIPTDVIGTEYIAMNTMYGQKDQRNSWTPEEPIKTDQKIYILATEDDTNIALNNSGGVDITLDKGESYSLDIALDENAVHINSDKPVYVYHVTGIPDRWEPHVPDGKELGSAILPPITCTGSTRISFTRVLEERFWVQIMTKDSNKGSFTLEDNNGVEVTGYFNDPSVVNWVTVPGTETFADPWVTAVIKMGDGTDGLSTTNPYTISNPGLFHMSILDENNSSMSFGYFSSFSSLRIKGPDIFCASDGSITLETQEPMNDYRWVHYVDEYTTEDLGTTPSIVVEEPGIYGLTASSAIDPQCVLEDVIEIQSVTPDFTIEGDTVLCPGDPIEFEVIAEEDYIYTWPDGSTGTTYTIPEGLEADEEIEIALTATYEISANNDVCTTTDITTVKARTIPVVEWNVEADAICLGDTLKAEIISGEDLILEYQWYLDGTLVENYNEPYIVPTQSGVEYSLTVVTKEQCDVNKTKQLTVHALPDIDITDEAVCPGASHTFTLDAGFTNYIWQGAGRGTTLSQTHELTMNQTDSVYVQVEDANGCINQDSAFFEVYNEQVFSFGADTSVCIGNSIDIEIHDNFSNYQWEFEGTSLTTTPDHIYSIGTADNSHEGTYSITAVDENGCNVSGSFNLDVQDVPPIGIAQEASICNDDEANLIKIGVENPLYTSFEWVEDSDPTNILSTNNYLLIDDAGTYRLTATQDNGCSNTATTTVTSWSSPTFNIPDETFCPNEEVRLALDETVHSWQSPQTNAADKTPRDYKWYTINEDDELELYYEGDDLGDAAAGNPEAGVYFLEVHDAVCKYIDEVEISYHELTDVELEDAEFCDNDSYTLEIPTVLTPEVTTYHWSQDGTTNEGNPDLNWTVTDEGEYTLNITDNNGCTNEGTMTLSHLPAPKFVLGADDDKCLYDTLMVMTEPSFTRYEWNGNTDDGQTNVFKTEAAGLNLTFSLQIWDENGCTATETANIDVFELPVVDLGEDREECPGHEITLTVDPFKEIYWNSYQQNITSITVGNGKHKVKVVDDNGCISEDSMTFTWRKLPNVDLGPDEFICPVDYPVQIEAEEGFNDYTWHNGEKGRFITADLVDTLNTVYVIDEFGCIGWDTKVVDLLGYPGYTLGNDTTACDSDELIIDAGAERISEYSGEQTITPFIDYTWNTGNQEQTQEITEPGDYWVEIFDGCFYLRDTIHVDYYPSPEITRLDTLYYAQVSVFADNGTSPYQFAMDDENRLQNENTFKNVQNGEHTVYVEDKNGCTALKVFSLNSTYDINVPNFFTPNNDGFNDTWVIDGVERLPDSEIFIYDRYGKLLRRFKASESISWDGEYQNKPVPSDDYWYVIHLQPVDKLIKGNVTIKR
ncbi:T9SS type B sorting domain-containing protein [Marinilabilia salmonicolor]|uniref:Gliding motility-associated-like protein n=1 Tax=Marinilabilia salmonicolor TaxID=989 RepID=A0A368VEX2_9BACT|nr:T9SS type B sorting domain-containing protein [Marinilabilia salmonicolor]RCW37551.1 gliding motility-associated-like protein [Marinilabilia salmonicolor]